MSARFWMFVPVLLLGATVAFAAWRIALVVNDPSFAEEEHAYERGLDWDKEMARRSEQADLGWSVSVLPPPAGGMGELQVLVVDRNGAPVSGLHGRVKAFHNSFPTSVLSSTLTEREPGVLVTAVAPGRAGLWQWQCTIEKEALVWHGTIRAEVAP